MSKNLHDTLNIKILENLIVDILRILIENMFCTLELLLWVNDISFFPLCHQCPSQHARTFIIVCIPIANVQALYISSILHQL